MSGTFVCSDPERVDTGRVSACRVVGAGATRTILRCDPALVDALSPLTSEQPLTDDDFLSWSTTNRAAVLGRSLMKTIDRPVDVPTRTAQRMNWQNADHIAQIEGFIANVDADDLDEAEIERDDLDSLAVCLLNDSGQMQAYASARPFDWTQSFGDIGIAVAGDVRRQGIGTTVLQRLVHDVLNPEGVAPLYRCDPDNISSDRLSASVGFETVLELLVVEVA